MNTTATKVLDELWRDEVIKKTQRFIHDLELGHGIDAMEVVLEVVSKLNHPTITRLQAERDMWKRRAEQHGCNVDFHDAECG